MNIINSYNKLNICFPTVAKAQLISPAFKKSDIDTFVKKEEKIPNEFVLLFENVKQKEGKDFIKASYSGLLNILNIETIAEKKINFPFFNWLVPREATAAASPSNASMTIYRGLMKETDKWEQFANVAHETFHIKQYSDILRLEDVDIDAYVDTVTDLTYPLARDEQKQELREGIKISVSSFQKKAKKLGTIKKDSEEGKHAQKLFEALKNYPRLNQAVSIREYRNNLLEKEAYEYQDKVYEYANLYVKGQH